MNQKRNDELMRIADRILCNGEQTILDRSTGSIKDSYNGHIAAFSVSIAMCGLCSTLAIYYKDSNNDVRTTDRKPVMEIIARMIREDILLKAIFPTITNAETLMRTAINTSDQVIFKRLKDSVIDCSIALKQVVRTYNLVKS